MRFTSPFPTPLFLSPPFQQGVHLGTEGCNSFLQIWVMSCSIFKQSARLSRRLHLITDTTLLIMWGSVWRQCGQCLWGFLACWGGGNSPGCQLWTRRVPAEPKTHELRVRYLPNSWKPRSRQPERKRLKEGGATWQEVCEELSPLPKEEVVAIFYFRH